jgi:hypothetical protein
VRTALTLEEDVARLIDEEAHRQRKPIKQVVNEALRRGLTARAVDRPRKRYRVRLAHALLGTPAAQSFPRWRDLSPQIRGQLTEQVLGQELYRITADIEGTPRLYTWHREGGRAGEVDFVLTAGSSILPVEIKSGAAGAMKSLHQFMLEKRLKLAARLDDNPPSLQRVDLRTTQGAHVQYDLLSVPHYLAGRLLDLAAAATETTEGAMA